RAPRTRALLSALARFGHPGVWAFLIHQLANEDLVDAAADALTVLFGARLEPESTTDAAAWRDVISRLKPDPGARYRRGVIWRPGLVASECTSGELSRASIELAVDELSVRTRIAPSVDLTLWTAEAEPLLARFCEGVTRCDERWPSNGW